MKQGIDKSGCSSDIAIAIEGLTKRYNGFVAVDNISFDIRKNEIFGLLGPNGAGKTTTINMICGLMPPTEGRITFCNFHDTDGRKHIGFCPQENIFYPRLTCYEQLDFTGRMYNMPSQLIKDRSTYLLESLGLKDKTNVRASKLSGGMKRRLNICLALIHDPDILVLDEPEAGLDPQSRLLVREFIKKSGRDKTIIITTHNMDEADRLSDRIAIIDNGHLLLIETPDNLKKSVGEGDNLELEFAGHDENSLGEFKASLAILSMIFIEEQGRIIIRHPSIIDHITEIKSYAGKAGLTITGLRLRENTLEDVFINLTGRSLRQ